MNKKSVLGYNVAILNQSGKVGNVRYFQRNGQTYLRTATNRTTQGSNPRSDGQMRARLRQNSLVALYSLVGKYLKHTFQDKEAHQNDYNAFMHANKGVGAYMTKQQKQDGHVVLLPVHLSSGTLPAITLQYAPDIHAYISNIILGSPDDQPTDISTIALLTQAVTTHNPKIHTDDRLTVITAWQGTDPHYTDSQAISITLDADDQTPTPTELHAVNGYLAITIPHHDSMAAIIHDNSKKQVSNSTASLTPEAMATLQYYTSAEQFQTARDSYGKELTGVIYR